MNEDDGYSDLSDILNNLGHRSSGRFAGAARAQEDRYRQDMADATRRAQAAARAKERAKVEALRKNMAKSNGFTVKVVPNPVAKPLVEPTILNKPKPGPYTPAPEAPSQDGARIANALAVHYEMPHPRTPGVGVCAHDAMVYPCTTVQALTEELPI